MAGTESILGQYEKNVESTKSPTNRVATDKDTFLKLLVAQLQHQDPLNPVEDKEFISQLAQFTTVEELQNIRTGMDSLNSSYLRQQAVSASSLIGNYVEAPGDKVTIAGIGTEQAYSSYINYNLPRDAASMTMNIYALNSDGSYGRLVSSRDLGPRAAGDASVQWDGRDNSGNPLTDGVYAVNFVAKDADSAGIYVTSSSTGRVIRVEMAEDGNHTLVLQDLRTVKFNDVKIIDDPAIHESGGDSTLEKLKKSVAEKTTAFEAAQTAVTTAEAALKAAEDAGLSTPEELEALQADINAKKDALTAAEKALAAAKTALEEAEKGTA